MKLRWERTCTGCEHVPGANLLGANMNRAPT
jgi:hypothetical protein